MLTAALCALALWCSATQAEEPGVEQPAGKGDGEPPIAEPAPPGPPGDEPLLVVQPGTVGLLLSNPGAPFEAAPVATLTDPDGTQVSATLTESNHSRPPEHGGRLYVATVPYTASTAIVRFQAGEATWPEAPITFTGEASGWTVYASLRNEQLELSTTEPAFLTSATLDVPPDQPPPPGQDPAVSWPGQPPSLGQGTAGSSAPIGDWLVDGALVAAGLGAVGLWAAWRWASRPRLRPERRAEPAGLAPPAFNERLSISQAQAAAGIDLACADVAALLGPTLATLADTRRVVVLAPDDLPVPQVWGGPVYRLKHRNKRQVRAVLRALGAGNNPVALLIVAGTDGELHALLSAAPPGVLTVHLGSGTRLTENTLTLTPDASGWAVDQRGERGHLTLDARGLLTNG